jgi:hypothetical protein
MVIQLCPSVYLRHIMLCIEPAIEAYVPDILPFPTLSAHGDC